MIRLTLLFFVLSESTFAQLNAFDRYDPPPIEVRKTATEETYYWLKTCSQKLDLPKNLKPDSLYFSVGGDTWILMDSISKTANIKSEKDLVQIYRRIEETTIYSSRITFGPKDCYRNIDFSFDSKGRLKYINIVRHCNEICPVSFWYKNDCTTDK
ncbi:hypothetical protein CNR22_16370 [Sphingobacteriaceae bacterium]|nr:hypothetical protein CNR22_16370 [Sphingobacteriaceae bacterium]